MPPLQIHAPRRTAPWSSYLAALACTLVVITAHAQDDPAQPTAAAPTSPETTAPAEPAVRASETPEPGIDYAVDIQPILQMHCLKCHGPERHSGGLRLDARRFAMQGGDSGRQVLGGDPATNELHARVSSSDRSYRMPKNAPPLSSAEISLLRRWVAQGTPWPAPQDAQPAESIFASALAYIYDKIDRYEAEYRYMQPFTIGFLVLMCVLLVVMRCRAAYRQGRRWATGRLAPFCRFCDGVKSREVLLVLVVSLTVLAFAWTRGRLLKVDYQLVRVKTEQGKMQSHWVGTVFGWPPKPVRSDHPKQVAGTYYRGNCERNPELFNGGNYLTATFRVHLCDKEHKRLEVGQPLPPDGIFVFVEIERAPGTTDQLFSKELIASVVLVKNFYEIPNTQLKEQPVRLETLEPGQRWGAYVPIGLPNAKGVLDGVIYMYTGQVTNGDLNGTIHYGVQFELVAADEKLSPESDLWMDSFGNFAFETPRAPGKLPYREWFDYRPLPVITGENSKDPKLLGVDEYVRKGLIKPEDAKSQERAPPPQPPLQDEGPPDDK